MTGDSDVCEIVRETGRGEFNKSQLGCVAEHEQMISGVKRPPSPAS